MHDGNLPPPMLRILHLILWTAGTALVLFAIRPAFDSLPHPSLARSAILRAVYGGYSVVAGVFVAGLKSKDVYDRSDAANFLAKVAEHAPAEMKAELIDLLQKGKAGDSGGLTAMGYDEALKKLGAP